LGATAFIGGNVPRSLVFANVEAIVASRLVEIADRGALDLIARARRARFCARSCSFSYFGGSLGSSG
jgi:citrate lyase gamma subunit